MGEYGLKGLSEGPEQKSSCAVPVLAGCAWPGPWGQSGPCRPSTATKTGMRLKSTLRSQGHWSGGGQGTQRRPGRRARLCPARQPQLSPVPIPAPFGSRSSPWSGSQEAVFSRWGGPQAGSPPASAAVISPVPSNPWPRSKRALHSATRTLRCSERMVLDPECAVCQGLNMPNI